MRSSRPARSRRFSALCLVVGALSIAVLSSRQGIANEKSSAPKNLSEKVEVELKGLLKRTAKRNYSIEAVIKNISEEPIEGPLLLVVGKATIPNLVVINAHGKLKDGRPFFRALLPDEKLRAGKSTSNLQIVFRSKRSVTRGKRRQFDVETTVMQLLRRTVSDDEGEEIERQPGSPASDLRKALRKSTRRREKNTNTKDENSEQKKEEKPVVRHLKPTPENVEAVSKIQDRWTRDFLKKEGVYGTATGLNSKGELVVRVYVERAGIRKNLPKTIDGIPVVTRTTGRIRLMEEPTDRRGQAGDPNEDLFNPDPDAEEEEIDDVQQRFDRPVPIGVERLW